jgi:hypothetical protein
MVVRRERDDEERYRVDRKVWLLEEDYKGNDVHVGLEHAARALAGLTSEEAPEVPARALGYSDPAARSAVAVARLRLRAVRAVADVARAILRRRAPLLLAELLLAEPTAGVDRRTAWRVPRAPRAHRPSGTIVGPATIRLVARRRCLAASSRHGRARRSIGRP